MGETVGSSKVTKETGLWSNYYYHIGWKSGEETGITS